MLQGGTFLDPISSECSFTCPILWQEFCSKNMFYVFQDHLGCVVSLSLAQDKDRPFHDGRRRQRQAVQSLSRQLCTLQECVLPFEIYIRLVAAAFTLVFNSTTLNWLMKDHFTLSKGILCSSMLWGSTVPCARLISC